MIDEVRGWISEDEPQGSAGGGFRKLPVLVAASAVVGVVAGAALMHLWDDPNWLFRSVPPLGLRVSAGESDPWIALPDRGAGGIAIIPLVLTNEGKRSIILTQVQVAGVASKLSTDPIYNLAGEIPETLRPGMFSVLQVPVAFDCAENPRPDPIVTFVGRQQNGPEQRLVAHPAGVEGRGGVWGFGDPCLLRYSG